MNQPSEYQIRTQPNIQCFPMPLMGISNSHNKTSSDAATIVQGESDEYNISLEEVKLILNCENREQEEIDTECSARKEARNTDTLEEVGNAEGEIQNKEMKFIPTAMLDDVSCTKTEFHHNSLTSFPQDSIQVNDLCIEDTDLKKHIKLEPEINEHNIRDMQLLYLHKNIPVKIEPDGVEDREEVRRAKEVTEEFEEKITVEYEMLDKQDFTANNEKAENINVKAIKEEAIEEPEELLIQKKIPVKIEQDDVEDREEVGREKDVTKEFEEKITVEYGMLDEQDCTPENINVKALREEAFEEPEVLLTEIISEPIIIDSDSSSDQSLKKEEYRPKHLTRYVTKKYNLQSSLNTVGLTDEDDSNHLTRNITKKHNLESDLNTVELTEGMLYIFSLEDITHLILDMYLMTYIIQAVSN